MGKQLMDEYLTVGVPRNLRVGTTIAQTFGTTTIRVSLPVFLWLCGIGLLAMVAFLHGEWNTVAALLIMGALGWAALEVRWWGYGSSAFGRMLLAHATQPRYLTLAPIEVVLDAEQRTVVVHRRPRWERHDRSVMEGKEP
jgi:hypothetical protein